MHCFVRNSRRHGQALLVHACLWLVAVFNHIVARRALPLHVPLPVHETMTQLTHFDEHGASRMVDISEKAATERVAVAHAKIIMKPETFRLIMDKKVQKGDVLEVARIAGIMAAKQTSGLIPLCHQLNLTSVKIDYKNNGVDAINVFAEAQVTGKTGVEMEAIVAASVCAITVYDMCKSVDKRMIISDIHLVKKSGGKSGTFIFDKDSNMPAEIKITGQV